jgi:hypothetical protein
VVEGARRPDEAAAEWHEPDVLSRSLLCVEGAQQDAVETADVHQVEGECRAYEPKYAGRYAVHK